MCSIAVVQVSVQWLHLRTWHLLSSAHNDLNRKARRRHLLQRPELCAAWLLSPLQTHIVNHLHRITYCRKSGTLGLAWIMLAWTTVEHDSVANQELPYTEAELGQACHLNPFSRKTGPVLIFVCKVYRSDGWHTQPVAIAGNPTTLA